MKKYLGIGFSLALSLVSNVALAQFGGVTGGPGPAPNPWTVNGNTVSYSRGGVIVGPTNLAGQSKGVGTINVSVGYFINGVSLANLPCTLCALTTNPLSQFAATTSAQLRGVISDETGGGVAVFNNAPTIISPVITGSFTATGLVGLPNLATQLPNTVLDNPTSGSASPIAQAMPSCSTVASALQWLTNSGFQCAVITAAASSITVGTTIVNGGPGVLFNSTGGGTLAAVPFVNNAAMVTSGVGAPSFSTTLPAAVQANITGTGTLTSGATGTGFTVALSSSTITGVLGSAFGGTGSNNAPFTISLGGSVVTAGPFSITGAFASTLTLTGLTNSTLPAGTHTLAAPDVVQTWTAAQTFSGGISGATTITSNSTSAFAVGPNGVANPVINVDGSVASAATGFSFRGAAAGAGAFISVLSSGANEGMALNAKGSGAVIIGNASSGGVNLAQGGGGVSITGATAIASASANALAVGPNGTTNPVLRVDGSIASQATGLNVQGLPAGSGLVLQVLSSGANENLTINAKGNSTIVIGSTSTGNVQLGQGGGGVVVFNSFTATGLVTFADMATAAIATSAQVISASANVLVPANAIYSSETTTAFGTTTTFDFSTFINTSVTLTGNITTMTLNNVKAGQAGQIRFIQDGTGNRTTVWNSIFKFSAGLTPTLSTIANAVDALEYSCVSSSYCVASLVSNVK